MTNGRKKRRRRNLLVKGRKTLSMEEKSPTMPGVVFLKYLKITATGTDSQGKFDYAVFDEIQASSCPHCHSQEVYVHGYYYRNPSAKRRNGARK